jgi:hypothetical protein
MKNLELIIASQVARTWYLLCNDLTLWKTLSASSSSIYKTLLNVDELSFVDAYSLQLELKLLKIRSFMAETQRWKQINNTTFALKMNTLRTQKNQVHFCILGILSRNTHGHQKGHM